MIKSMTGYGRGESITEKYQITVEIKTVNSRFLEVVCRVPKSIYGIEENIKQKAKEKLFRGRIEVSVTMDEVEENAKTLVLDQDLSSNYHTLLLEMAELYNLEPKITLKMMAKLPGIFVVEKPIADLEEINEVLAPAVDEALDNLIIMREKEGESLAADLIKRNDNILHYVEEIAKLAPEMAQEHHKKLRARLEEYVKDIPLDEERLAMEIALFADKVAIDEELIRLESHIKQMQEIVNDAEGAAGRKLEFIMQEMNREANTIGSKASIIQISQNVIEIKSELEKIREQLQNVE